MIKLELKGINLVIWKIRILKLVLLGLNKLPNLSKKKHCIIITLKFGINE